MERPDEIELIAREYIALGVFKCRWAIKRQLSLATSSGDWSEIRKWYRVQLCVRTLLQGETSASIARIGERAGPAPGDAAMPVDTRRPQP